jgi:[ribosomal protein S18]-alanine N-acetyltransferase
MSCHYQIKNLTLHDLPSVMDIGQRAYNISWSATMMRDTIQAAHTQVWGIYEEESMLCVGFGVLSIIIDEAELLMLCVDPDYQRRGFGSNLLKFLIEKAKYGKVDNFYIEVRKSNKPALGLFEKHEFNKLSVRKDYYPDKLNKKEDSEREDAIILGLKIR